jgi:predicted GIY-YIG superfamily endonuclease
MNSPSKRFVYYIQSAVHRSQRYSGLTSEVAARMSAHNAGQSPHTAKHRPWILLASIEFTEETRAVAFEQYFEVRLRTSVREATLRIAVTLY